MYRKGLLSNEKLTVIWKHLKLKNIRSHTSRYIECNPYYYNIMDIIIHFFPNARFVFIVRSPKSFIISHIKWEKQRLKSYIANQFIPYWQPTSYLEQLKGFRNNYYQRVLFYSRIWFIKNKTILEALEKRGHSITLKFEDIFNLNTGIDILSNLVNELELSLKKPITNEIVDKKMNVTKGDGISLWDDRCDKIMKRYCGRLMKEFGYE